MDVQVVRAMERTKELQLIKDKRRWTPLEREEFFSLLELLHQESARRVREMREQQTLKKKRVRPKRLPGIH